MTVKGGTTPACAACKYQRRRCTPNCALAPYFPANKPKMFQDVHRLYGVSNITKTLKSLQSKDHKEDAMKSIIFEAEMRQKYPVHGCSAVINELHHRLQCGMEELQYVLAYLARCREQMNKQVDEWTSSNLEIGSTSSGSNAQQLAFQRQLPAVGFEIPYGGQFLVNESNGFYPDIS